MPTALPISAIYSLLKDGNKKGMGVPTFAHPCSQAFALPRIKDKQRSQPTPSDYINNCLLYHNKMI